MEQLLDKKLAPCLINSMPVKVAVMLGYLALIIASILGLTGMKTYFHPDLY